MKILAYSMNLMKVPIPKKYKELSDGELADLYIQNNNNYAFSELINRYQADIYSRICSIIQDKELAKDIFQNVVEKMLTKMKTRYNDQGKWLAWALRIAHNASIDHIRKMKKYSFVKISSNDVFSGNDGEDSDLSGDNLILRSSEKNAQEVMEHKEESKMLHAFIEELPEEQKRVLILRHYYEMQFKEIAEITGVSINTALGRMRYALINLRKMFNKTKLKKDLKI